MNIKYLSIILFYIFCNISCLRGKDMNCHNDSSIILNDRVTLGDPFILLHDGLYYAYGTNADDGIEVYISDDLLNWRFKGLALKKDDVWGERWFWAPEVYKVNGMFYMYYSADEHICVAKSESPLGPFKQDIKKPMIKEEKCIDSSLFIDSDGIPYLFFDRFNDGLNVWVVQLEDDLMTIKNNTMHHCIHVSQDWEEVWPRVNEGPFVIKHDGVYYMTYSANSYESPDYGIGCASSESIMGKWDKYDDNPLLQRPKDLVGVGHSSMFTDRKGDLRIAFHAHKDKYNVHPRAMYIGRVSFNYKNDECKMQISDNFIVPRLIK